MTIQQQIETLRVELSLLCDERDQANSTGYRDQGDRLQAQIDTKIETVALCQEELRRGVTVE